MQLLHSNSQRWTQAQIVSTRNVVPLAWVVILAFICVFRARADETIPFVVQDTLYRTNLAISNIDSFPAEVSILLYENSGLLAAQGTVQIPSLGIINLKEVVSFAFGYPQSASFEGFVRLRSTARLAALASQIRNANNDPGIIAPVPQGASQLLLPITTSIGPWSSTLAVVNLTGSATAIKVSLHNEAGSVLAELERNLDGNSQWIATSIHKELGIDGVRGSLMVQSLNGSPLAAICRHSQTFNREDVFQQPFDLRKAGQLFYLPYWHAPGVHSSVVLNNLNDQAASVTLRALSPLGTALNDYSTQIPAFGSVIIHDVEFLKSRGGLEPYGVIHGTSNLRLSGLAIRNDWVTRDTVHINMQTEFSPEILVPSVTQVSPFSSALLMSNLGDSATWVEITHRTQSGGSAVVSRTWLPAKGSVYLNEVLPLLGVPSGYGPLQLRSVEGQPIAAFSDVSNADSGARGAMNSVDTRPSAFRRLGDRITLRWDYPASEIPKAQEYRIYRADRMERKFQMIASVPIDVLEYSLDMTDAGDFVLSVKTFNGIEESTPSNEVLVRVIP